MTMLVSMALIPANLRSMHAHLLMSLCGEIQIRWVAAACWSNHNPRWITSPQYLESYERDSLHPVMPLHNVWHPTPFTPPPPDYPTVRYGVATKDLLGTLFVDKFPQCGMLCSKHQLDCQPYFLLPFGTTVAIQCFLD